jgi:hypothetical protein
MRQYAFTPDRTRSSSSVFFNGNFDHARITRPMLLQACSDVESELCSLLRRQRWVRLGKLLRRAIGR